MHQYDVFSTGAPFQEGIARFLSGSDGRAHLAELPRFYEQKRDRLLTGLQGSRWTFSPAEAGYFQVLDYSAIDTRQDLAATQSWCSLKEGTGIALIPLSSFYPGTNTEARTQRKVRVCFAKNDETLDEGIKRLWRISNPNQV